MLEHAREHLMARQQVYDAHVQSGKVPLQVQYDHAMGVATLAMLYNRTREFEKAIPHASQSLKLYRSFDMFRDWKMVPYFAMAHFG